MKNTLLCFVSLLLTHAAIAQPPTACRLTPAQLSSTLGTPFDAGKDEGDMGALGHGCSYRSKNRDYSLWLILVKPAQFGMTTAQLLALSEPGTFKSVPNDPDGLRIHEPKADVSPFPSIIYERGGTLVKVRIVGTSTESTSAMNDKLARLPRIP